MSRYGKNKSKAKVPVVNASRPMAAPARPVVEPPPPGVLLLTSDQLATLLNVSLSTINRMAKAGTLPGRVQLGNRVLYHRPTVEAWIADLASRGTDEP